MNNGSQVRQSSQKEEEEKEREKFMAKHPLTISALAPLILLLSSAFSSIKAAKSTGLSYGYYSQRCPNVERIIFDAVARKFLEIPTASAGVLRIFLHDCFVEGCDASVLIASTESNKAERDAEINLSLSGDGYDLFFRAKAAVELHCPGVVSCADVMTIATRDSVYMLGGPRYEVQTGRRDGLVLRASRVDGNIPQVNQTISQLISIFKYKGLTVTEMVALLGAHSIGASHCKEFISRIYHYNSTVEIDPTMNQDYARRLRATCPEKNLDPTVMAFNDVTTPLNLDNVYYKSLQKGLGLLASDQILFLSRKTQGRVNLMATDQALFVKDFATAMIKLSSVGIKTGTKREIRQECASYNV